MTERMIKANGIDICTEAFGDAGGEPLLLIMGASAQMLYWTDEFIQPFVNRGSYVIRYDNRDTGRSTCFDFASSPYTLDDLVKDAVGVLDAYQLDRAHVAGASMGSQSPVNPSWLQVSQLIACSIARRLSLHVILVVPGSPDRAPGSCTGIRCRSLAPSAQALPAQ